MTLSLTGAKSFGQKAMVVIHYQLHNRRADRTGQASEIDLQPAEKKSASSV